MSPARAEATARVAAPAPKRRPSRTAPLHPAEAPAGPGRLHRSIAALRAGSNLGRIGSLALVALFASVFGVVVFQTLIVQGQGRLDDLSQRTSAEQERSKDLHRQLADLEAPDRVVAVARERLGMVTPADVAYLLPGADDDARATYVAPPTAPAPPARPASGTGSATSKAAPAKPSSTKTTSAKTSSTRNGSPTSTTPPTTAKASKP